MWCLLQKLMLVACFDANTNRCFVQIHVFIHSIHIYIQLLMNDTVLERRRSNGEIRFAVFLHDVRVDCELSDGKQWTNHIHQIFSTRLADSSRKEFSHQTLASGTSLYSYYRCLNVCIKHTIDSDTHLCRCFCDAKRPSGYIRDECGKELWPINTNGIETGHLLIGTWL